MPEFGTSGLRGLAVELTDELCATYAAAFVAQHGGGGAVFVGQDRRDSSPRRRWQRERAGGGRIPRLPAPCTTRPDAFREARQAHVIAEAHDVPRSS